MVANNEDNIFWFLVKRTLVSLNRTTGPTVTEKLPVKSGTKFVRDDLGDANNFVEDILSGCTNRVGRITAVDGDDRVVFELVSTRVGITKGIVVRLGKDTSTWPNEWQRAHYRIRVQDVKWAADSGSPAGEGPVGKEAVQLRHKVAPFIGLKVE